MWKNIEHRDRTQMTKLCMHIECWITRGTHTQTHTHTHTHRICDTYCFSTSTIVARKRLNVIFIRSLPVLSLFSPYDVEIFSNIAVRSSNAANRYSLVPNHIYSWCTSFNTIRLQWRNRSNQLELRL